MGLDSDIFTPEKRHTIMSLVKSKNSVAELTIRSILHKMGYRFRLHVREMPGVPDIVLPKYRAVIFVQGCFWHQHSGCRKATLPKQNAHFWKAKLSGNATRDSKVQDELKKAGWNPIIIWECAILKNPYEAVSIGIETMHDSVAKK
jgi:DNA mismatch endonuclease (patch repair protein)